ncbi:CRIB domain-containing protein RIC7-like [Euphorbia lathyris]|uniref:CRIB domain-containing protein RIC7-like n=1 Tax=Euphorbia lathyris TaxID=212925 RepID=UPI00331443E0
MSNNKMKGLLKGLRYISQIFDNEKEPDMQIGFPTDVKHVAHIGWDGPSVNSPSWMNEFKEPAKFSSSAPLNSKGEPVEDDDNESWVSEESKRISKSSRLDGHGEPSEKPKSRRNSSSGALGLEESKSEKPKQRRSSKSGTKDSSDGKSLRHKDKDKEKDSTDGSSNPANLPKKTRRKKSKDISSSKASRSKSHAVDVDCGSDCGSVSKSVHNDNSECGSNVSASFSALEDETENGVC